MKENINKQLLEYENLEKQLELVLMQRQQTQMQLNEIKHAKEELKKAKGDVYRSVGSVLIKSTVSEAQKDLKDREELLEVRLSGLEKSEKKLRETATKLQKELQERMKGYGKNS